MQERWDPDKSFTKIPEQVEQIQVITWDDSPTREGDETTTMEPTSRAQKDNRWKRAREYVRKHREMTRIGMIIGCCLAVPFLLAATLAAARGAGAETAVWLGSALLMVAAMAALALWSSRRD